MLLARKLITLTLCVSAVTAVTGCTGPRWLSRNDYSQLHDPFMQPSSSLADAEAAPNRDLNSVGVARMGESAGTASDPFRSEQRTAGLGGNTPGIVSLSGPKPIQRVAASDSQGAPGGVSRAVYPGSSPVSSTASYPGPSLSDFMSSPDSATTTATAATAAPAAGQGRVDHEFEEWAAQQYHRFETATPIISAPGTNASSVNSASATPDFDVVPGNDPFTEVAEPLIQRPEVNVARQESSRSPVAGANPFAEYEAELQSGGAGATRNSQPVNNQFDADSGWKPANFTRP